MELFEEVFNKATIYDMMFFNVKAVLIHPTLDELQKENPALFDRWKYLSKTKYGFDMDVIHGVAGTMTDETPEFAEKIYEDKAIFYPEFSRILVITYAEVRSEDGTLKRDLKRIAGEDEGNTIGIFMDVLHQKSREAVQSTPQYFPILTGHNILNYDLPLLIKRFLIHKNNFTNRQLPFILKRNLGAKPWESRVIDTVTVWKFNGNDYTPLMLIADYLGLKKTVDLEPLPDVSRQYWEMVKTEPEKALDFVGLQSANQTNVVIQLMNELRQL